MLGWEKPGSSALCGRSPQPIPLEGKPVSPETSQFYSERLNSLKCKNQLRDGRVSSGAPCSSWRGGTLHHSLAQLYPPTLLHGRGRVMLQPPCHAENSEFLDPPNLSSPPSWIPKSQKPLGIRPRALQQPPHLHSCEKEISLTIRIFNIYLKSVEAEPAIASTNARPGCEPVPAS